jgi:hypothetical protein
MQPSDELKMLYTQIEKYDGLVEGTTDQEARTALLKMLAAMRQEMVPRMQGEQAKESPGCMV